MIYLQMILRASEEMNLKKMSRGKWTHNFYYFPTSLTNSSHLNKKTFYCKNKVVNVHGPMHIRKIWLSLVVLHVRVEILISLKNWLSNLFNQKKQNYCVCSQFRRSLNFKRFTIFSLPSKVFSRIADAHVEGFLKSVISISHLHVLRLILVRGKINKRVSRYLFQPSLPSLALK